MGNEITKSGAQVSSSEGAIFFGLCLDGDVGHTGVVGSQQLHPILGVLGRVLRQ